MRIDGIQLVQGSNISNLVVASGSGSFPPSPDEGELYFRTDSAANVKGLYCYIGGSWDRIASSDSLTAPVGTTLPMAANAGDLFYKNSNDGSEGLYAYNDSAWVAVSAATATYVITGDVTGTIDGGTDVLTLATVNATTGSFGNASSTLTVAVNAKGLVTSVSSQQINIDGSQVTSGTLPVGRISAAGVTQHQTSITALGTLGSLTVSGTATAGSFSGSGAGLTSIPNSALVNSSVTVGSTNIALGGTSTTLSGLSAVTSTSFIGALTGAASANLLKAGDTMTGLLTLSGAPSVALHAATKQYVDDVASGMNVHLAVVTATSAALATCTYGNGSSGVGGTLTANANGALTTLGGYSGIAVGNRILVKDQASTLQNGIYTITSLGSAGTPWVLTRAIDFDGAPTTEIVGGDSTYVQNGTAAGTQWVQTTTGTITVGTTGIVFTQFGGPGTYSAGTGISITSNVIANTGVVSVAGTTSQVAVSSSTGAVTISLPSSITIGGTMTAATFVGNLTGASSLNVLKAGDTMTGALVVTNSSISQVGTAGTTSLDTSGARVNFTRAAANYITAGVAGGYLIFETGGATARMKIEDTAITVYQPVAGAVTYTSTNDLNAGGSNFAVNTVTKSTALYAYDVQRSGSSVGGIKIDGSAFFTTLLTSSTVTAGGQLIGGASIAPNNYVIRAVSTTGDRLRIASLAAGSGALIDVTDAAETTSSKILSIGGTGGTVNINGTVNATITGAASLNVLKAGDTMTGNLTVATSSGSAYLATSPAVTTNVSAYRSDSATGVIYFGRDNSVGGLTGVANGAIIWNSAATPLVFGTGAAERMRIDASGNVGVRTTVTANAPFSVGDGSALTGSTVLGTLISTDVASGYTLVVRKSANGAATNSANIILAKSAGTAAAPLTVANNDALGSLAITAYDGTSWIQNTSISTFVDGAVSTGVIPTRFTFSTSNAERMRIDASGNVGIGTTTPASVLHVVVNGASRSATFETTSSTTSAIMLKNTGSVTAPQLLSINDDMGFQTNGVERMRIVSAGTIGIGMTVPYGKVSIANTALGGLHLSNSTTDTGAYLNSTGTNELMISGGASYNSYSAPNFVMNAKATTAAGIYINGLGVSFWTNSGLTTGTTFNQTERMRISSAGSVLINRSSDSGLGQLQVAGNIDATNTAVNVVIYSRANTGYNADLSLCGNGTTAGTSEFLLRQGSNNEAYVWNRSNAIIYFGTNNTERMRLTAAGDLLLGKTISDLTNPGSYFEAVGSGVTANGRLNLVKGSASGTGGTTAIAFYYAGTSVGSITSTSTATAFNTSSDERIKENIAPAVSASAAIDAMQVREYDFRAGGHVKHGFVAQELHAVVPEAVHVGGEDPALDPWAVDYSKLVPMLIKEIQELRVRVAALEK